MALIDRKLEDWKRKLLDLTRRNPALFFKPEKPFNLRLSAPDAQRLLSGLLVDEKKRFLFIPPPIQAADPDGAESAELEDEDDGAPAVAGPEDICFATKDGKALRRRIKSLHRAAQADFEERALETLHLALGLLHWSDGGSETCISPLLLVPVRIARDAEKDLYTLGPADDDPVVNPSLAAKLGESFRLTLPDLPEDWEDKQSYAAWLDGICEAVRPYKWSVEDSVWLARFSFHKLSLYHDLKTNAERLKDSALIHALAGEPYVGAGGDVPALPDEKNLDREIRPHESYVVLDADSSQLVCIEAVDRGHNLIVQGPPGTGKSQTIVNLVAQLLAKGKTVLFVSEKIAALEVVFNRLKSVGLGNLCLELHSHKANKREVVCELANTLSARPRVNAESHQNDLWDGPGFVDTEFMQPDSSRTARG